MWVLSPFSMELIFPDLNYLAVLVAALAAFAFGFLVHGPLLGNVWMSLMKVTPEEMEIGKKEMEKKMPLYMLVAFLQQVVAALVLAHFAYWIGVVTVLDALSLAFWCWLGFVATTLLNSVLWEKRSLPLYGFNVAYHFGSLAIVSLIVTLWR